MNVKMTAIAALLLSVSAGVQEVTWSDGCITCVTFHATAADEDVAYEVGVTLWSTFGIRYSFDI